MRKKQTKKVIKTSYRKLKENYNNLWNAYVELHQRTKLLGISEKDFLIGDEEKL